MTVFRNSMKTPSLLTLAVLQLTAWATPSPAGAQDAAPTAARLTINVGRPGPAVSPTLYGAFFEDINRAGDGGLYAEMVQNRSFEDFSSPLGWTTLQGPQAQADVALDTQTPLNANNPTSLRVHIAQTGGRVGVYNQGFKGVPEFPRDQPQQWAAKFEAAQRAPANGLAVQAGRRYALSLYARAQALAGPLTVSLETQTGVVLAAQRLPRLTAAWKKYALTLTPEAADADARLVIAADAPGTFWLDMVSLFPRDTFKNRPNGLRPDLAAMMAAMHPAVLRFPGGSFSEGHTLDDAWRWKQTVGDIAARPGSWDIWGYRSTNGLGLHEYLQLCEDLGAAPLFVAHAGMAERGFVPVDQLGPWVQDALDAIEYANGPATSQWGALRAKNGHPKPFGLKYVEIGNENGMGYSWGGGNRGDYLPRYRLFHDAIKAKYPSIVTIANIHTEPDAPADIVDEHYYESTDWFQSHATLYDHYDRSRPKIYLGEYAARGGAGGGNLNAALSEAAFLTGVERNSDVVVMTSYAPLFTDPSWQRWSPDAIHFDSTRVFGTPTYYVQSLFAANRPDVALPLTLPDASPARPTLFGVAGLRRSTREVILKIVNTAEQPVSLTLDLQGAAVAPLGSETVLTSGALGDENSFDAPTRVAPRESRIVGLSSVFPHTFPARSLTILRVKLEAPRSTRP